MLLEFPGMRKKDRQYLCLIDAVVDSVEDTRADGKITHRQAKEFYKKLGIALDDPNFLPRPAKGFHEQLKRKILDRISYLVRNQDAGSEAT